MSLTSISILFIILFTCLLRHHINKSPQNFCRSRKKKTMLNRVFMLVVLCPALLTNSLVEVGVTDYLVP